LSQARPKTIEHVVQARQLVKETTRQIREMCFRLRPSILDEVGLAPALRWLTHWFEEQYGVQVGFGSQGVDGRLSSEIETTIYRLVQEGLTNAMRHAQATSVSVHLEVLSDAVTLNISDDGVGFELSEALLGQSSGLVGMRERVGLASGTLDIHSQPGQGTQLAARIPLPQSGR
jgi:signal transduction histidine kinase